LLIDGLVPRRRSAEEQWLKLVLCLAIDFAGDATYLFPGLGEAADIAYAPLEALALRTLFGGNLIAALGFVEEALPFTDVIPTATIGWLLQTFASDNPVTAFLGIQPLKKSQPPPVAEAASQAPSGATAAAGATRAPAGVEAGLGAQGSTGSVGKK